MLALGSGSVGAGADSARRGRLDPLHRAEVHSPQRGSIHAVLTLYLIGVIPGALLARSEELAALLRQARNRR